MQKSSYSTVLIFLVTLALVLPARVQALSIQLNDNGTIVVQPGNVLGDSTEQQGETQIKMETRTESSGNTSGGNVGNVRSGSSGGSGNSGSGSGGSTGNFGGGSTGGSNGGVAPAEIRSTSTRPVQLSTEALKKQEEQRREMTQKTRKETEQASRVKRMIENKKSSVEVEMSKSSDDSSVKIMMREFDKSKQSSEDAKNLEEKKRENIKELGEKQANEVNRGLDKRSEQELENNKEDRKIKSTVEERTDKLNFRMGTTDVRSTNKGFEIEKGDVKVQTNLPVSVQTDTKQLSVVTPQGTKTVTTLPDEAKNTVESSGLANKVVGEITLEQQGNDVVFHMNTSNSKRMFGFIPVQVSREVDVSATTGQITNTTQSLGQRLLDLFSF